MIKILKKYKAAVSNLYGLAARRGAREGNQPTHAVGQRTLAHYLCKSSCAPAHCSCKLSCAHGCSGQLTWPGSE